MTLKTVSGILAAAVADAGTFTVTYPTGFTKGDFQDGVDHRLVMAQVELKMPKGFTISFGATAATITNKTGAAWAVGSAFIAQLELPGANNRVSNDGVLLRGARSTPLTLVSLGSPALAATNNVCASQSIAAAGLAVLNGALLASSRIIFDVPRNIVAAWTTASVLTITGKDEFGNVMVENSASGASHTGAKAFKEITSISSTASITGMTAGTGVVLGLPVFVPGKENIVAEMKDGAIQSRSSERIYLCSNVPLTDGTYAVAAPVIPGTIKSITVMVQGVFTTNNAVLTFKGGAAGTTAITTGVVTPLVAAVAVGDTYVVSPTAANTVAAGDKLMVVVSGTPGATKTAHVIIEIEPTQTLNGTLVAGNTAALSATCADVRGTYSPLTAPDGTIGYQLILNLADPGYVGGAQFAG